jgi:hypothetical protein
MSELINDSMTDIVQILKDMVESAVTDDIEDDILILLRTCIRISAHSSGCNLEKKDEIALSSALFKSAHTAFCESRAISFASFKADFN